MTGVRLNSEKRIEHPNFKIKLGTTNKTNPEVVYIEGRTFISPLEEQGDYTRDINDMRFGLKSSINQHIRENNIFDGKFILDFQVASSGIKPTKKSFLSFQFILRQKGEIIPRLLDIKKQSEPMILLIINDLQNKILDKGFTVSINKK